jgi:hypothetical protein
VRGQDRLLQSTRQRLPGKIKEAEASYAPEAISCFLRTKMDVLFPGNYMVTR